MARRRGATVLQDSALTRELFVSEAKERRSLWADREMRGWRRGTGGEMNGKKNGYKQEWAEEYSKEKERQKIETLSKL